MDVPYHHDLGSMSVECLCCHTLHWMAEQLSKSSIGNPRFGKCCYEEKITLPPLPHPPCPLIGLFTANDPVAKEFRTNIIRYNSAFAFTSLGAETDYDINECFSPDQWVFKIHGQLQHLSGALEAEDGASPSYSQLYLYDPKEALEL